jgi:6-phosphogluconolactonase (cycloisomerase 2 family)
MVEDAAARFSSDSRRETAGRVALYASVGPELTHYDVDVESASLVKRNSVKLPANVQYAWPHASGEYFYVASSDRHVSSSNREAAAAAARAAGTHHLTAFRVDTVSGALQPHGKPVPLRHRPVHMTTDIPSEHALVAYTNPSGFSVHRINADGTLGEEVKQHEGHDLGIYAHQIRVAPANELAILVTRGHPATRERVEEPGALKVFKYRNGIFSDEVSIAPGGGYGFGPRHLDFHPSNPWVYVSLETQHKMCLFTMQDDALSPAPLFSKGTLADPANIRPRQFAGTVHVHPNGRVVYGVERADGTAEADGRQAFVGGENSIVVYGIDQQTGEPELIQRIDTRGMHPRTFAIDPSGRVLVAANKSPVLVWDGSALRTVPASLDLFRVDTEGRLTYVRKYDIDVGNNSMFWMGLTKLQSGRS